MKFIHDSRGLPFINVLCSPCFVSSATDSVTHPRSGAMSMIDAIDELIACIDTPLAPILVLERSSSRDPTPPPVVRHIDRLVHGANCIADYRVDHRSKKDLVMTLLLSDALLSMVSTHKWNAVYPPFDAQLAVSDDRGAIPEMERTDEVYMESDLRIVGTAPQEIILMICAYWSVPYSRDVWCMESGRRCHYGPYSVQWCRWKNRVQNYVWACAQHPSVDFVRRGKEELAFAFICPNDGTCGTFDDGSGEGQYEYFDGC